METKYLKCEVCKVMIAGAGIDNCKKNLEQHKLEQHPDFRKEKVVEEKKVIKIVEPKKIIKKATIKKKTIKKKSTLDKIKDMVEDVADDGKLNGSNKKK